ncbi:MAG: hypothetical protein KDJ77_19820 [Rhodobiaceae bacterium]|nr:hypothetical protein [Rhodobiaceae bacterium]
MTVWRLTALTRLVVVVVGGLLLAACEPGAQFGEFNAATSGSARVVNLVGAPDAVKSQVLAAISTRSTQEGITFLTEGQADTEFTVSGFMSALDSDGGTQFAYVWDVFDKSGQRRHRIAGSLDRNAKKDDPWAVFDAAAAKEVAGVVVTDMKDWLKTVAPPETPAPAPAPAAVPEPPTVPEPAAKPAESEPKPAEKPPAIAEGAAEDPRALALVEPVARTAASAAITNATPPSYSFRPVALAMSEVTGIPTEIGGALTHAITRSLVPYGIDMAQGGGATRYLLTADVSTTPAGKGRDFVAIIWTVSDHSHTVGTVRQLNTVAPGSAPGSWTQAAAESAANGIATLIQPNPVK